jgi:hypothetical protein
MSFPEKHDYFDSLHTIVCCKTLKVMHLEKEIRASSRKVSLMPISREAASMNISQSGTMHDVETSKGKSC